MVNSGVDVHNKTRNQRKTLRLKTK